MTMGSVTQSIQPMRDACCSGGERGGTQAARPVVGPGAVPGAAGEGGGGGMSCRVRV